MNTMFIMDKIIYNCKRCLYSTDMKHSLVAHLSRKIPCEVSINGQDIDQLILFQELGFICSKNKEPICEFCLNSTVAHQVYHVIGRIVLPG